MDKTATQPATGSRELLSPGEAAAYLGVATGTIHAWVSRARRGLEPPRLPFVALGNRLVRFRRTDLDAWIAARLVRTDRND